MIEIGGGKPQQVNSEEPPYCRCRCGFEGPWFPLELEVEAATFTVGGCGCGCPGGTQPAYQVEFFAQF